MIQLKISGMTCGHCVMAVREALASVQGVEGPVEVDLASGLAKVPGAPETGALLAAVREEGFEAAVVA